MAGDNEGRDPAVSTEAWENIGPWRIKIPNGCGCIYIVKYGPYYKIGKTVDPNRPYQIARAMNKAHTLPPFRANIQLIFFCWLWNLSLVEKELHRRFTSVRKDGEWFELSKEQYAWMIEQDELPYWNPSCECGCEQCARVQFNLNYVRRASIPCPS